MPAFQEDPRRTFGVWSGIDGRVGSGSGVLATAQREPQLSFKSSHLLETLVTEGLLGVFDDSTPQRSQRLPASSSELNLVLHT